MDQALAVWDSGASPAVAMATDSDPHVIALVRQGDTSAFDILYRRHLQVAQYVARTQTDNQSDADDVVAEAFASILQSLTDGKGPNEFFRSYLLTVVRRTAHDRNRKARRAHMASDDAVLDSPVFDVDPVVSDLESSIMAKAFKSLPERWQAVLWHVDIEGLKPAAAAPLVGLTPNGVSSLAIRAREGLRQAYLQHHVSHTVDEACGEFASQLGKYARNALKRTSMEKVGNHLGSCAKCTALYVELNDIQGGMRAILFPVVTGIAFSPAVASAFGTGATAAAPAAYGSGATASLRGASMWKWTAWLVLGILALVGVLGWLLQPASESTVADAVANTPTPPVQATSTPTAVPSAVPEPTLAAPLAPPATPALEDVPQQPAVVIPEEVPTPRTATVADSGFVFSTTAPQATAAAAPPTQTVEATFAASADSNPSERDLKIDFSLVGDGAPSSGEAVFTLPDEATFISGKTVAPAGWECAASGARQVRCTTALLDRAQLNFGLAVTVPANSERETLNYKFGGQGIVPKTFANTFH